jgi:transcriptional regulator with XRE-family HTH domain
MRSFNHIDLLTVTQDEKVFFTKVGSRIAACRQEMNWSQQHLGELIGVPQQTIANYETARLRVPASLLPKLAQTFSMSVDELLGVPKQASKRGPASQLQRSIERISELPKPKQRFVIEMLETVLAQASR